MDISIIPDTYQPSIDGNGNCIDKDNISVFMWHLDTGCFQFLFNSNIASNSIPTDESKSLGMTH